MKTVLHITNTSISVTKLLEVVPKIEDWLVIYESADTSDRNTKDISFARNYDNYCRHQVKGRDWHLYDDHTEASILLSACNRRDKCILAPHD